MTREQRAMDLLRRLVEWDRQRPYNEPISGIVTGARALLAGQPEPGPVAEDTVGFVMNDDGRWTFYHDVTGYRARIPVPRHIYDPQPVEGEVVE